MRTVTALPRTGDLRVDGLLPLLEADHTVRTVTAAYSATGVDDLVLCDATGGAFTVTLPPAAQGTKRLTIKRTNAGVNAVTIDGYGAETIEGSASVSLGSQYSSRTLQSNGVAWFILAST